MSVCSDPCEIPWETEKQTIRAIARLIDASDDTDVRLSYIAQMYKYLHTIGPYLSAKRRAREAVLAKAVDMLADPRAEPIHGLLISTIALIATLKWEG